MKTNYHIIKPLKGYGAFKSVYDSGKVFRTKKMILVYLKTPFDNNNSSDIPLSNRLNIGIDIESAEIKVGVTISKRVSRKAVIRNRVKRLLRESLRQIILETYLDTQLPFNKLVIAWRNNPGNQKLIHLDEVKIELKYLLKKVLNKNNFEQ